MQESVAPVRPMSVRPGPSGSRHLTGLHPAYLLHSFAAIGAFGVVLVVATPMALAATSPVADPVLYQAVNGTPNVVDLPAPAVILTDQNGVIACWATLAVHTAAVTLFDPTCMSDCPLIA